MLFLAFLIAALTPAVHAQECYDWLNRNDILGPDPSQYYPVSLAFDKNVNKMVMLTLSSVVDSDFFALWYLDGDHWEKAWEGDVQTWSFAIPPCLLYYDRTIHALVWICCYYDPFYGGGLLAFKYDFLDGFISLGEGIGSLCIYSYAYPAATFAYDTLRKKVVILGTDNCYGKRKTIGGILVEFDGQNFNAKELEGDLGGFFGVAGYNPDTRNVVFYGLAGENDSQASTWEYDGSTWVQIQTEAQPSISNSLIGMAYLPQYQGLLAVETSNDSFNTWLYDSTWHELEPANPPSLSYNPVMALNPATNRIALDGWVYSPTYQNIMWEFRTYHCRPVSRP